MGSAADDHKFSIEAQRGIDGEIDAFVGFERSDEEEVVSSWCGRVGCEEVGADGRVDDGGVVPVAASDLVGGVGGVGDVVVDASSGGLVPCAEAWCKEREPECAEASFEIG